MTLTIDSIAAFFSVIAALQGADKQPQDICIGEKTFRGCCSHHIGVRGVTKAGVDCLDGTVSQSCTQRIKDELNGCCSYHKGFSYVDIDSGKVLCTDEEYSPTCTVKLSACHTE